MTRLRRAALTFVLAGIGSCALNPDSGGTGGAAGGEMGSVATGGGGGSATGSGGNPDGPAGISSGLARSLTLASLSEDQASALCDWEDLKEGGYNRVVACAGGPAATYFSNQICLNSTSALGNRCQELTVGDIEDCANATGPDLCRFATAPECIAVTTCDQ